MELPIPNSYWVVPGKFLAGEYPRTEETLSSQAKLDRLRQAGVSVFVDLTGDADSLLPYADLLDGCIHEQFPIRDVSVPESRRYTAEILDTIDRHLAQGATVYLHCWGGVGRTGVIVGCWLARHGYSGESGLSRLRSLWRQCAKADHKRSPETSEQEAYIRDWHESTAPAYLPRLIRYAGSLLGLAAGDAVGTTLEFKSPGTFTPLTDMVGGGPFGLEPGQWTDDTSMALCLAHSLIEAPGFNATDQMDRYVRWWKEGYCSSTGHCFDIGGTVRSALARYLQTGNPLAGESDPYSAGNGSLMRLAPVPLYFASDPSLALTMSEESSRTTHAAQTCLDACRYFGGLLLGALRGASKEDLLSERYAALEHGWGDRPLGKEIDEIARGSFKHRDPPQIQGSGYVVKSLEAALWAFDRSSSFEEGCLLAVNLGDDADTTGAIFGQLAGAYYGVAGIPPSWLERLHDGDAISSLAWALYEPNAAGIY